jgi:hypothetical protein
MVSQLDSSYTIIFLFLFFLIIIFMFVIVVLNKPKASLPNYSLYKNSEAFGLLDFQLFNVKEVMHVLVFLPCKCA